MAQMPTTLSCQVVWLQRHQWRNFMHLNLIMPPNPSLTFTPLTQANRDHFLHSELSLITHFWSRQQTLIKKNNTKNKY
jgi:hypothetical protein